MTKEERTAIKKNIATAIEAHRDNRNLGPLCTCADLVGRIGYTAAVETVAALVNCVGTWDGRVSDRSRAWAAGLAADREELRAAGIYLPSEIHPAHIDQLAATMARYEPQEEPQEEPEEPAQAEPVRKHYLNDTTGESTTSAAQAMGWHRRGDLLTVTTSRGGEVLRSVTIAGAPTAPARPAEDENRAHCRRIAQELDAYVHGEVCTCPECGEEIRLPEDVGDRYRCPHCGTVHDLEDLEQLGIWDFLADVYDIEYRCSSEREWRSVQVMIACGGPNIYLDSASKDVELYWWSERARYPMSYEAVEALESWAEEMWSC